MEKSSLRAFSEINTKNLLLRGLNSNDKNEILAIRSDPVIAQFLDRQLYKSAEEALQFIYKINDGIKKNKSFYWAVTTKNDPGLVGTICLWNFSEDRSVAEVGFEILPAFQGKGIMNEALSAVIHFGFNNINLVAIEGEVHKDNQRSINLLEKKGFKLKQFLNADKAPGMLIYQLLKK